MKWKCCQLGRASVTRCLVLIITVWAAGHPAAASDTDEPASIAVLTVEGKGTDLTLVRGLADLLEHELRTLGTRLVERRALLPILRERRLDAWARQPDAPTQQGLPGVTFFLVLELTGPTDRRQLAATLVDRRDGRALRRWQRKPVQEDKLGNATRSIAQSAHRGMPASIKQPAPADPVGFTTSPETAAVFYRGLAELSNGRLTRAVGLFSMAYYQDTSFYLARLWQARALDRLGMTDFAAACREDLRSDNHRDAAALLALDKTAKPQRITLLPVDRAAAGKPHAAITRALADHADVHLLGPGFLANVVRENDLAFSGVLQAGQAVPERWLAANALLWVDDQQARLLDAVTGQLLAYCDLPAEPEEAARQLIAGWRDSPVRAARMREAAVDVTVRPTEAPPGSDSPILKMEDHAFADRVTTMLDHVVAEPNNLDYLNWLYHTYDNAFEPAQQRIRKLVLAHPDLPNAAAWLREASYNEFEMRFHRGVGTLHQRLASEATVRERYRSVLEHDPDSTSAWLLRMGIGYEHARAGEHDKAIEAWLPLWERWDKLTFPEGTEPRAAMRPRLSYLLARSLLAEKRVDEAQRVFKPCREYIDEKSSLYPYAVFGISRSDHQARWSVGGVNKLNHTQIRRELMYTYRNAYTQARALALRLDDVAAGRAEAGPYLDSRDLFLKAVSAPLPEAIELHLQSLDRYARVLEKGNSLSQQVRFQLAFVCFHARTAEAMTRVDAVFDRIMAARDTGKNVRDYCLIGRFDQSQETARTLIRSTSPRYRLQHIMEAHALDTLHLPIRERADRLEARLAELETLTVDMSENKADMRALTALAAGPAWLNLHEFDRAKDIYQAALDEPGVHPFDRLRLIFGVARAEAAIGHTTQAAERLRNIVRLCQEPGYQPDDTAGTENWIRRSHRRLRPRNTSWLSYDARALLENIRIYGPLMGRVARTPPVLPEMDPIQKRRLAAAVYLLYPPRSHYYDIGHKYAWDEYERLGDVAFAELIRRGPDNYPLIQWLIHARAWDRYQGLTDGHLRDVFDALDEISIDHPRLDHAATDVMLFHKFHQASHAVDIGVGQALPDSAQGHPLVLATQARHAARHCNCRFYSKRWLRHFTRTNTAQLRELLATIDHPDATVAAWSAYALAAGLGTPIGLAPDGEPDPQAVARVRDMVRRNGEAIRDQLASPNQPRTLPRRAIQTASFAADRPLLAAPLPTGGYALWSLETGRVLSRMRTDARYWPIQLSRDGTRLAGASSGKRAIDIWRTDTAELARRIAVPSGATALRFSPDGQRLHVGLVELNTFRLSDGQRTRHGFGHWRQIYDIQQQPDTNRLVTAGSDHYILLWDQPGQAPTRQLGLHENTIVFGDLSGRYYLSPSWDQRASIWDLHQVSEVITYRGHRAAVTTACFIPDSSWVASATNRGVLHIWSRETGQTRHTITAHAGEVIALRSYAPGSVWSVAYDGFARQWNTETGKLIREINLLGTKP